MSEQMIKYTLALSTDPNSGKRNRSWVKLVPLGETIDYHGEEIEFSEAYLRKIVSESIRLQAYFDGKAEVTNGEPYRFPVLRNHKPSHDRDGDLLGVKLADKQGFNGLWGEFEWTDDTLMAIDAGKVKHVSVGITPKYKTEGGDTFGPVIREVSLTADPFLKGIGTIQDTLEITLSQQLTNELAELNMEPEALMKMFEEAVSPILDRLDALAPKEEPEDADEASDEASDDASLEASLEASQSDGDVSEGEGVEATSEEVEEAQDVDATDVDASHVASHEASQEEPEEALTLSAIKALIDPVTERLAAVENRPSVRLNTQEQGRQGDPPTAPVELSYEDTISRIMRKNSCSRLDAIELEMKQ